MPSRPRTTVYLSDAAYGEVQRRVDAGEAPAMSAWIAGAVERTLAGADPGNGEEVATLRDQLATSLAAEERQRNRADAAEARCRTVEEERDAAREECHALEVRCAAAEGRCEGQQSAVESAAALADEVKTERDRLLQERDAAREELRQRSLPMVVEPDAPAWWQFWKK